MLPFSPEFSVLQFGIKNTGRFIIFSMLTRVWQELEYRIDVCHVTHGAHIEPLKLSPPQNPVAVNNSIKVGPLVFLL
jgi:hypothetical protein